MGSVTTIAIRKISGTTGPAVASVGVKLKYRPLAGDMMMAPSRAAPTQVMEFARRPP